MLGSVGARVGSPVEGRGNGSCVKVGWIKSGNGDTIGPGQLECPSSVFVTSQITGWGDVEWVGAGGGELTGEGRAGGDALTGEGRVGGDALTGEGGTEGGELTGEGGAGGDTLTGEGGTGGGELTGEGGAGGDALTGEGGVAIKTGATAGSDDLKSGGL